VALIFENVYYMDASFEATRRHVRGLVSAMQAARALGFQKLVCFLGRVYEYRMPKTIKPSK
tara:strand:+ start:2877 stop:3059 length:183 start_codon:yes stop_codon:yes gene_type:complete